MFVISVLPSPLTSLIIVSALPDRLFVPFKMSDKWSLGHSVPTKEHHEHQASLEAVYDMSGNSLGPLASAMRQTASHTFYRIIEHFAAIDPYPNTPRHQRPTTYSRPQLVRLTYEHALSDESRDVFLRAFFGSMALAMDMDSNAALDFQSLASPFEGFAVYLMDNFFLAMKASLGKTPQPSPASHSTVLRAQSSAAASKHTLTPDRLSTLRGACLLRDRHRCVISHNFDDHEYISRFKLYGQEAYDDDRCLLTQQDQFEPLEVAHILPYSLMKAGSGAITDLQDAARKAAIDILNMFDMGVAHMIDGVDIDRPRNALTLTYRLHHHFGAFNVYFEPVPNQDNTYRIQSFLPPIINNQLGLPVTRALFITDDHTIDPPSRRLLAIHNAIAHILHLSGAGGYADRMLRDMEDGVVRADGSSELGSMVHLNLLGRVKSTVY
ncbi:hypothetical protein F503_02780 [Ophiostoma piceae UAMH 11346]|uniref:HNH nuclease domain-containing protein n=1 Tax=Ophiostoma piceae (strain UAMH 11346) TaxID=1262450 RepID=S3C2G7_OPHP1|nr:hypothetical protein F503_02780 [Ophiostoma piceae UAMH 11346]